MSDIANAIRAAAVQYGLDPNAMLRIAQIESGLNPAAANPRSSARGVYQFISPTWRQYGGGANPLDATANIDAGMRLAVDNRNTLRNGLGRDPTPGELYLAHQQGAGGALNMLRNPNAPVGGDAIALNGGAPGMTGGQFAQKWTSKFDGSATGAPEAQTSPQPVFARAESGLDLSPLAAALQQAAAQPAEMSQKRAQKRRGPLVLS